MLLHSFFESIKKIRKTGFTLCKRVADNLNQKGHKLVWNLSKEYLSTLSKCLKDWGRKTKYRCWQRLSNLGLQRTEAFKKSEYSKMIFLLKLYQNSLFKTIESYVVVVNEPE